MPPTELEAALTAAVADVAGAGSRCALVGGLAVSVRAEIRFTRDIDLAVAAEDDAAAEELVHSLTRLGYRAVATVEQDAVGRLSTVRMVTPQGVKLDLLFASSGLEREVVDRAELIVTVFGRLHVARPEELVAMKVLSMSESRLQDRMDVRALLAVGPVDLEQVRANLRLIQDRGFARQQDLLAKFESELAWARA